MTCGIYKLTFPSGKIYIGSSKNIERRWYHHTYMIKRGKHNNSYLANAYNKYGEPVKSVLLVCRPQDLLMYEQLCIDQFEPVYNIAPKVGFGSIQSVEGKKRIGLAAKERMLGNRYSLGKKASAETKEKMRISAEARGGTPHTPETKDKISQTKAGVPWSEARRAAHKPKPRWWERK